jgi:hypothetical protein
MRSSIAFFPLLPDRRLLGKSGPFHTSNFRLIFHSFINQCLLVLSIRGLLIFLFQKAKLVQFLRPGFITLLFFQTKENPTCFWCVDVPIF